MRLERQLLVAFCTFCSLASAAFATPIILDFDHTKACNPACSNGELINQNYGDVAGLVDVTYTDRTGIGATPKGRSASLFFWSTGFTGLSDVAFTNTNDTGEIAFAAPGHFVTLVSLDLSKFNRVSGPTKIYVFDASYALLASIDPLLLPATVFHYAPLGGIKSTNGLILQWGADATRVGLDNVVVDVEKVPEPPPAVPEPGTVVLLGLGLAALGVRRRASS